jgi:hypothetical protein
MPRIVIESDKLANRGRSFNNLLGPLVKSSKQGLAYYRWSLGDGVYAITAYNGKLTLNFNEARFSTSVANFDGQYFEIWMPVDRRKMDQWYLNRAYLNIYNRTKEYVCLHCDPEDDKDDVKTKACYKQSPHIHIKIEHQSISKSHIAIAHGFLDKVYSSYDDFFNSIRNGVELIRDEILNRYEE